ncbi:uncharacterized protein LY89DRAFT_726856 [Mollisia scopiformis]|uniref:Uncharacterized protein n=1 Tax=Mollisia scopiformis TaxID=149040 RepID=A0A194XVQ6_MOLSC|nr:uncharacterized protein LY89DRAFT_726856 [Mollisia scopiformis]KUJ23797.1 hypothetical protein LY89DRAFT_726856 [Mollisia scopiformis]
MAVGFGDWILDIGSREFWEEGVGEREEGGGREGKEGKRREEKGGGAMEEGEGKEGKGETLKQLPMGLRERIYTDVLRLPEQIPRQMHPVRNQTTSTRTSKYIQNESQDLLFNVNSFEIRIIGENLRWQQLNHRGMQNIGEYCPHKQPPTAFYSHKKARETRNLQHFILIREFETAEEEFLAAAKVVIQVLSECEVIKNLHIHIKEQRRPSELTKQLLGMFRELRGCENVFLDVCSTGWRLRPKYAADIALDMELAKGEISEGIFHDCHLYEDRDLFEYFDGEDEEDSESGYDGYENACSDMVDAGTLYDVHFGGGSPIRTRSCTDCLAD